VCGQDPAGRELVTIAEAAQLCRVSKAAIYRWMHRGRVEWIYNAGGYRRIYRDTLIRKPEEVEKSCAGGEDQKLLFGSVREGEV
jgi:excisionase family DNA binding protein